MAFKGRVPLALSRSFVWTAIHDREIGLSGTYGVFSYDGRFIGNAYADFLLGLPGTSSRMNPLVQNLGRFIRRRVLIPGPPNEPVTAGHI